MTEDRNQDRPEPGAKIPVTDKRAPREGGSVPGPEPENDAFEDVAEELSDEVSSDEAALVAIRTELEQAWKLAGDRLDQLKRMKADHENMKARLARERAELQDRATAEISERLLPVLDDLYRALDAARDHDAPGSVSDGLEIVVKQFGEVLRSVGVERMDAEGAPFDPQLHEAMTSTPGDVDEPTVGSVIRPGYRFKDRTLRPALVMVTVPEEGDA